MPLAVSSAMSGGMSSAVSSAMSGTRNAVNELLSHSDTMVGENSTWASGSGNNPSGVFSSRHLEHLALAKIMKKLDNMVYIISFVGIFGNTCSMIVLINQGFSKSSNILLFSLAVMDNIYLIADALFRLLRYLSGGSLDGLIHVHKITNSLLILAHYCTMTIPVMITLERLVAVMLPLKFKVIVIPRRVWLAVTLNTLFAIACRLPDLCVSNVGLSFSSAFVRNHTLSSSRDRSRTLCQTMATFRTDLHTFITYLQGVFAISFVTIGCMIIGAKVTYSIKKRGQMTSRKTSLSDRTTTTLLSVLAVYIPSGGFYVIYRLAKLNTHRFSPVFYFVRQFLLAFNSSCNCFIYVLTNRNFRQTLTRYLIVKGTLKAPKEK